MATVFLVILCISAVAATCDITTDTQNNRAAEFVGSFSTNLNFLNKFFSANNIDNYKYSSENIPTAHLNTLGRIAITYSNLRGEFVTWCTYVDHIIIDENNPAHKEVTSLPEYDANRGPFLFDKMRSKSLVMLRDMRQSLQSINVNGGNKGRLTDNQHRYKRSDNDVLRQALEDIREKPFKDDLTTALNIIGHLVNTIDNNLTINLLNASQMKCQCQPVLRFASQTIFSDASAPGTPASQRADVSQKIMPRPSKDDLLERQLDNCVAGTNHGRRTTTKVPTCNAYLAKSSLRLLDNFYTDEIAVAEFLNRVNSSRLLSQCREHIKKFLKNNYFSWGYDAPNMIDSQLLHISVRHDNGELLRVQVIN